jgi:hypothetical protein
MQGAISGFSQNINAFTPKKWEHNNYRNFYRENILPREKSGENRLVSDTPRNSMPVVRKNLVPKFLGNNGKGADVYAMLPYNMPCLVPDSSFRSSMPVTNLKNKRTEN